MGSIASIVSLLTMLIGYTYSIDESLIDVTRSHFERLLVRPQRQC